MVHFSFTLLRGDVTLGNNSGELRTVRKLSKEWTFLCLWNEDVNTRLLKPVSVEFRRVSSTDIVSISGYFRIGYGSLHKEIKIPQKFTKFMEPGSLSVVIEVQFINRASFSMDSRFDINVTITSLTPSVSRECQKCTHLVVLGNDLGRLLEPETSCFADVNLKCGDASIPAHKVILSARSPVFAAMFRNPMKENRENEVVISEVDEPVLRLMLSYLYTAKLSDVTVLTASDLLIAADKYQIDDLKAACCVFLKDNLSLENVLIILFLGDEYDNDLKLFSIEYICNTCKDLRVLEQTEEWKTMREERPDLAVDILTSVVKAKEKNI